MLYYIIVYEIGATQRDPTPDIEFNKLDELKLQWISSVLCVVSKCLHLMHPI